MARVTTSNYEFMTGCSHKPSRTPVYLYARLLRRRTLVYAEVCTAVLGHADNCTLRRWVCTEGSVLDERTESDTIMDVYVRSEKRRNEKV